MTGYQRADTIADDGRQFDSSRLMWLGGWGCAAVIAVTAAVLAGRTELGAKRLEVAYAAIMASPADPPPAMVMQLLARTADVEREARRLNDTIRSLTSERDRLTLRLGMVEREMGDLTGSITRGLSGASRANETRPAPLEAPPAQPAPPIIATPTTAEPKTRIAVAPLASAAPSPAIAAAEQPPQATGNNVVEAVPIPAPRPAEQPAQSAAAPSGSPPPGAIRSAAMAPHAPAEPPAAPAAAGHASPAASGATPQARAEATPATDEPQPKAEIGIDLGPGLTLARLRQRWTAFKAAHGTVAEGLRPIISIREMGNNKPVEMRLVAGPVADVNAAMRICAALQGSQFMCFPAVFDGQRLALK